MGARQVDHAAISASASVVSLLAAARGRTGVEFDNTTSSSDLVVKVGGTATLSDYTWRVPASSIRYVDTNDERSMTGIWSAASGAVKITEKF